MNPYFAYSISFIVAITIYALGWSDAYPPLSLALLGFLGCTIIGFTIVGFRWQRITKSTLERLPVDNNPLVVTIFIYVLWAADFFYEGGIPLLKILLAQPYNYRLFGIPSLHVFTVTFSSFYTIYLFHLYLSGRKKLILILYFINLSAAVLIYSRAMFMFNVCASIFIFFQFVKKLSPRMMASVPFLALLLFYLFGVFGNLRVSREAKSNYDNSIFLNTGQATQNFRESIVPNEFFWSYIYASSSLANLQQNINHADRHVSWAWFGKMVNNEMLFDFISKRINTVFNIPHPGEHTIEGPFNVSTIYSKAFSHLSWIGMAIMSAYLLLIPFLYYKLLSPSPFLRTGLAILTTMFLFTAYDNTISFTGLSFQLIYPILFSWLEDRKIFSLRKLPTKNR